MRARKNTVITPSISDLNFQAYMEEDYKVLFDKIGSIKPYIPKSDIFSKLFSTQSFYFNFFKPENKKVENKLSRTSSFCGMF